MNSVFFILMGVAAIATAIPFDLEDFRSDANLQGIPPPGIPPPVMNVPPPGLPPSMNVPLPRMGHVPASGPPPNIIPTSGDFDFSHNDEHFEDYYGGGYGGA